MDLTTVSDWFNQNSWVLAVMIIIGNVGAKYLGEEFNKKHDQLLNKYWIRKFVIFALVFSGTRNLKMSLTITLIYCLFIMCLDWL